MTIQELREARNKTWEGAKAFVESKRDKDGLLSAEDAATYAEMEKKVKDYSLEIERMEQMDAMENELRQPVNVPIVTKPVADKPKDVKVGRASDEYKNGMLTALRTNFRQVSNRYNDNLLEEITLLIEALVEQQERMVFSEAEDTLTARLQHQLLKLRNILKAQNQMLTQEKEQIKTLISDISHQIKTPVAAANTFAQLLGDTGLSDEERSEYIATLQMSLEKLTFLTNSLIKMSRLESGIIRLKPEQNSLNDIVMQAVKTVYAKARDKNITITFDCGQTFEALLDFNWTAEAVTNVLDNAVKYTPSGGVVDLKITEYPSYLRLDVSDNGIGIPEEEQAKIFGRFYRGKQSAGVDGVGIGLYLTRDIVNKQNGYIKVASDEKGTTFSLFLKKFREQ